MAANVAVVCPLCERAFGDEDALLEHCGGLLPEPEDEPYYCSCGVVFCSPVALATRARSGRRPTRASRFPRCAGWQTFLLRRVLVGHERAPPQRARPKTSPALRRAAPCRTARWACRRTRTPCACPGGRAIRRGEGRARASRDIHRGAARDPTAAGPSPDRPLPPRAPPATAAETRRPRALRAQRGTPTLRAIAAPSPPPRISPKRAADAPGARRRRARPTSAACGCCCAVGASIGAWGGGGNDPHRCGSWTLTAVRTGGGT